MQCLHVYHLNATLRFELEFGWFILGLQLIVVESQLACVTSTTRKYLSNADVTAAAAAAGFAIVALLCVLA